MGLPLPLARQKLTEIGLGSLREVSLAQARERAAKARQKLKAGENPKPSRTAGEARSTFTPAPSS